MSVRSITAFYAACMLFVLGAAMADHACASEPGTVRTVAEVTPAPAVSPALIRCARLVYLPVSLDSLQATAEDVSRLFDISLNEASAIVCDGVKHPGEWAMSLAEQAPRVMGYVLADQIRLKAMAGEYRAAVVAIQKVLAVH